jgi:transcriptional regulator with XRE-family HTH domain
MSDDGKSGTGGERNSLVEALLRRSGRVAGGTLDLALDVAAMSAMYGDSWLRNLLSAGASPERLEAMAEAGRFLRDARETAGLSIKELSERLDLNDSAVLEGVERGEAILPLEIMLRAASLLARHDPVPFLIRFLRSYNPQVEATLEQWGVMALPRNYERERRFVNLYRQHDFLRDLDDDAYTRFIEYMDASTQLVVDVMQRERAAKAPGKRKATRRKTARKASAATASPPRSSGRTARARPASADDGNVRARPVRKVKARPRRGGDDA